MNLCDDDSEEREDGLCAGVNVTKMLETVHFTFRSCLQKDMGVKIEFELNLL